jgi:flagellar hook-length control protein FliK
MSTSPITNKATAAPAAAAADAPCSAAASDSDFGPILQAASASPAGAPGRNPAQPAPRNVPDEARPQGDGSVGTGDHAPVAPADARAARRAGRAAAAATPQDAGAAAAAALACSVRTRPVVAAAPASASDARKPAGDAPAAGSARSAAQATAGSTRGAPSPVSAASAAAAAPELAADAAVPALQAIAGASAPIRSDPASAGEARTSRPQAGAAAVDGTDHPTATQVARAALVPGMGRSTAAGTPAGVDQDWADGSEVPLQAPVFGTSPADRTLTALAAGAGERGLDSADGAAPHPGAGAISGAPPELADVQGARASAGFAPVAGYAPEARTSVATPVGQPGFGQELSERVLVLAHGGVQTAHISLEPAGLGPVGVSIQIHGHAASLAFTAAHEATRDALQAALPRLREMFAASGMQLADASVGGQAQPDWSAPARGQTAGWQGGGRDPGSGAPAQAEPAEAARTAAVRLVDTYA